MRDCLCVVGLFQQLFCMPVKHFSGIGKHCAPAFDSQDRLGQVGIELTYGVADAGLAFVQRLGGAGSDRSTLDYMFYRLASTYYYPRRQARRRDS